MTFFIGNTIEKKVPESIGTLGERRATRPSGSHFWPHQTTVPDPETGQSDPNVAYAYTAQAAEVVVDMETGQVKIDKIYCAIDVGKAINPQQVLGQIQGGLVQSVGYTVMENFIEKEGQVLTPSLSTYLVPTVLDIPGEMNIMVLENPDPPRTLGRAWLG